MRDKIHVTTNVPLGEYPPCPLCRRLDAVTKNYFAFSANSFQIPRSPSSSVVTIPTDPSWLTKLQQLYTNPPLLFVRLFSVSFHHSASSYIAAWNKVNRNDAEGSSWGGNLREVRKITEIISCVACLRTKI
jgi:hypothetical protein